ncbi:MAG TPA: serine hydrolase [Saprospiraceae bacterium]|nr:serine hydrolase [Saprospiraceae bacterium]
MILRRIFPLSILLCFLNVFIFCQPAIDEIDRLISNARKTWDVPGMAVGIYYQDKVYLSKGYGYLEAGGTIPVDEKTLFAIASNTKAYVATLLGILVEEGMIRWEDPVRQFLPWINLHDPLAGHHLNIRDLLCHRSGLGTFSGDVLWYKSEKQPKDFLHSIQHLEPAFSFRDGYGYSNLMFITAGEIIHAVTGKTWYELAKERIWDPLGMKRTTWTIAALAELGNAATPHKFLEGPDNQTIPWTNWDNMGAAGGIISSVEDMLQWIALHIDSGQRNGKTIYPKNLQSQMWQPHNSFRISEQAKKSFPERNFAGYGLGWSLMDFKGNWVVQHGGGYDGMYSKVCIVPEKGLGIVILTNSMKSISNPLSFLIIDQFLGTAGKDWLADGYIQQKNNEGRIANRIKHRMDNRTLNTQPHLTPDSFIGVYRCPLYGDISITQSGEKYRLEFQSAPLLSASLTHWHYDTWQILWDHEHAWFGFGTLQIVMDHLGKAHKLVFDVPNDDIYFEEIQAVKVLK